MQALGLQKATSNLTLNVYYANLLNGNAAVGPMIVMGTGR